MNPSKIYFISGANRGIGLGLTTRILKTQDNAFVYAGVRDLTKAPALKMLESSYAGRFTIVKCVSADVDGNMAMAKEIEERHGRVDTVIANAGIMDVLASVAETDVRNMEEHFHVNVMGPIVLFQSMINLLKKSSAPRFIPISSGGGCIGGFAVQSPVGTVSYGATKAALNWATRKIHFENEWLVSFPLSPGPVDTDMLQASIASDETGTFKQKFKSAADVPSVESVSESLLSIIDASTREKDGGEFVHVDGTRLQW